MGVVRVSEVIDKNGHVSELMGVVRESEAMCRSAHSISANRQEWSEYLLVMDRSSQYI